MDFDSKKVLFAGWGTDNQQDVYMHQMWYYTLKKVFKNIVPFDTKKNYFQYGKEIMNQKLLEFIKSEKPDNIIIAMDYEEIDLSTFGEIRKILPNVIIGAIICDDDVRFEIYSRYYSLFLDYVLISQDFIPEYKKNGMKNVFFNMEYNTYKLKPMSLEKIYDLTFIGRPKADRYNLIKYLLDNGIKINIFGFDWYKFPEFKELYHGPLNQEDYAKIINQSKINLSLIKSGHEGETSRQNFKGRFCEVSLCRAFQLAEASPILDKFYKDGIEIATFQTKEELLQKIKYFLTHEKEREKIADNAYQKTIAEYNRETELKQIFTEIYKRTKNNKYNGLPKSSKKILTVKEKDFDNPEKLKSKLKNYDYVCFQAKDAIHSPYKKYLQARSLQQTGKKISCCDYYVYSPELGNYLCFISDTGFKLAGKKFHSLIDINQLMVTRDFFLDNQEIFKNLFQNIPAEFITQDNTAFVIIPLVQIRTSKITDYEIMKKVFVMKFIDRLYSLAYQKKFVFNSYIYRLLLKSISEKFIFKHLLNAILDKNNWDKLAINKSYMGNSFLKIFTKKL